MLGQFSSQFFAKHGYNVLVAQVRRHYPSPRA